MSARNRLQLFRTATPAKVPTITDLLDYELALNVPDKDIYVSLGTEVIQLNHSSNIKTDATNRFISDAQILDINKIATNADLGKVIVGSNINVNGSGVISLELASPTQTGVLSDTDFATFAGKQDALGYTAVNLAGDTMLGTLVLAGSPTAGNDAANKTYVDQEVGTRVSRAGDTMTGLLVLSADPAQNLGAATKQYVDNSITSVTGTYAAPVQTLAELTALPIANRVDRELRLVEDTGAIFRYDTTSSETVDGVGVVAPDDVVDDGRWIKISAATQNHNMLSNLQGGAANDFLHLTTAEKNSYDAHLVDDALHLTSAQNTLLDALNASALELNYSIGVTGPLQAQIDGKQADLGYTPVNRAGDTMTGFLTLSANPTNAMHAVNLDYLETYVIDCGQF